MKCIEKIAELAGIKIWIFWGFCVLLFFAIIISNFNMKKILLLLFAGLLLLTASGQNTKVTGRVFDELKQPAVYATVLLLEKDKILGGSYSDEEGNFSLGGLKEGKYSLKVQLMGYETEVVPDFILKTGETKIIDVYLKQQKVLLEEVVVSSKHGGEDIKLEPMDDALSEEAVVIEAYRIPVFEKDASSAGMVISSADVAAKRSERSEAVVGISALKKPAKPSPDGKLTDKKEAKKDMWWVNPLENKPVIHDEIAGKLTAGEVNDFSKWKMWRGITKDEFKPFQNEWKMIPEERYMVQVENENHHPIPNLKVALMSGEEVIWTGRTDNTGKAELWKKFFQLIPQESGDVTAIRVFYDGKTKDIQSVKPFAKGINRITVEKKCELNRQVDIAFVVDATGSMGDEISHIRADLKNIATLLKDTLKSWDVNFGCVFYQDHGDEYLTKSSPFSNDTEVAKNFMTQTPFGGGGDFPEAVEYGLEEAIQKLKWNDNAVTRIIFLVLDAPAHNDTETLMKLQMQIRAAAHKGIRIIPVACSGIDKSTEYLLRSIALATNGTYAFLTDDSGVGNPHIKPTTDDFKVEKFFELAVRLVCQYTFQPECQPDIQNKGNVASVFQTRIVEKKESKAKKEGDEVVMKDTLLNKVWVKEKVLSWKYYPNPTQGILTVELDENIGEIFLSDISGKVLERYEATKNKSFQIDLSPYANGIYFLRYEYEADKWLNGKVILER